MFDQTHKEGVKERKRLRRLKSLNSSEALQTTATLVQHSRLSERLKVSRLTHPGLIHFSPFINSLLSLLLPPMLSSLFLSPSFLLFVQRDWLLRPAPGAETLANSVALHCVG